MKILHILASNSFSGAENVVCQIVGMFSDDPSIEMIYCSPDGPIRGALDERGVRFAPISALNLKELRRVIREQRPDLIHAHDMRATFVAALACGKIPLVSHIHGNAIQSRKINARTLAFLAVSRKIKHIFWVSESSYDGYVFHSKLEEKSSVLRNVISVNELTNKVSQDSNSYDYDIAFVGRMVNDKNPKRFLKIVKEIRKSLPGVRAVMLGDGYLFDEVKAEVSALGLSNNVEMMGFVKNPMKIIQSAKVMLITSVREGTPMCALEAMSLGVPLISVPTDGLREIICDGYNGYLSDDDDFIADKTIKLLTDIDERAGISRGAIAMSEKLNDLDQYKSNIAVFYKK